MSKAGQSSMILIILVIFIILGIGTFLLSFSRSVSQSDYLNVYAHNMLLSVLRSDTGYNDASCKLVSDAISCRFFTPSRTCGQGEPTCKEVAIDSITRYLNSFELISENFKYLVTVTSDIIAIDPETGHPVEFRIYSEDGENLDTERGTKYTANERIQKILSLGTCNRDFSNFLDCQSLRDRRDSCIGNCIAGGGVPGDCELACEQLTTECKGIIKDEDQWEEAFQQCKRNEGSYTLKAQLTLARR